MISSVLTVCLGNICRSPAAEAAIRRAAASAGIDLEVDSAGTGRYHVGETPHPKSVAAGAEAGLDVSGRARQISPTDFERFDLIVAMDSANCADLLAMAPPDAVEKIRLFRSFDPHADGENVPDPYYGTDDDYRQMIQLIVSAACGLVDAIREGRA